jgi:hypothetical protein
MIEAFVRAIADGDATAALGLADWLEDEAGPSRRGYARTHGWATWSGCGGQSSRPD